MRNISFQLTTEQVRKRTKTVTRRLRWLNLKAGERLQGCVKCMGLKPGEKIEKLAVIEVVSVRREKLRRMRDELFYGIDEVQKEGFSYCTPKSNWAGQFILMFCKHMAVDSETEVTRIEFKYVD